MMVPNTFVFCVFSGLWLFVNTLVCALDVANIIEVPKDSVNGCATVSGVSICDLENDIVSVHASVITNDTLVYEEHIREVLSNQTKTVESINIALSDVEYDVTYTLGTAPTYEKEKYYMTLWDTMNSLAVPGGGITTDLYSYTEIFMEGAESPSHVTGFRTYQVEESLFGHTHWALINHYPLYIPKEMPNTDLVNMGGAFYWVVNTYYKLENGAEIESFGLASDIAKTVSAHVMQHTGSNNYDLFCNLGSITFDGSSNDYIDQAVASTCSIPVTGNFYMAVLQEGTGSRGTTEISNYRNAVGVGDQTMQSYTFGTAYGYTPAFRVDYVDILQPATESVLFQGNITAYTVPHVVRIDIWLEGTGVHKTFGTSNQAVIDSDLTVEISRDGGLTYTFANMEPGMLTYSGLFVSGYANMSRTGIGSDILYRISSYNGLEVRYHGVNLHYDFGDQRDTWHDEMYGHMDELASAGGGLMRLRNGYLEVFDEPTLISRSGFGFEPDDIPPNNFGHTHVCAANDVPPSSLGYEGTNDITNNMGGAYYFVVNKNYALNNGATLASVCVASAIAKSISVHVMKLSSGNVYDLVGNLGTWTISDGFGSTCHYQDVEFTVPNDGGIYHLAVNQIGTGSRGLSATSQYTTTTGIGDLTMQSYNFATGYNYTPMIGVYYLEPLIQPALMTLEGVGMNSYHVAQAARVVVWLESSGSDKLLNGDLNVDFEVYLSRDDGVTYVLADLEQHQFTYIGSLVSGFVSFDGTASGTTVKYKVNGALGTNVRVHGIGVEYIFYQ